MSNPSYLTVAGLLYAVVAAGILCRVFFHFAVNPNQLFPGAAMTNAALGRERVADQLIDVALALPLLVIGFALQTLGQVTSGGLNWLGVVLALALAFGLLLYGLMKSDFMEVLQAAHAQTRERPAHPALLLPTPEPRPDIVDVEEVRPVAEVKTRATGKQGRQPRAAG